MEDILGAGRSYGSGVESFHLGEVRAVADAALNGLRHDQTASLKDPQYGCRRLLEATFKATFKKPFVAPLDPPLDATFLLPLGTQ